MLWLATGDSGWGDLAPLFGIGVLTGLSPWLFAFKGLPWFPKLPTGAAVEADGTARLLFTAAASICSAWVYMIFVSLPPLHFLIMHRGLVSLSISFGALLIYTMLWLWLTAMESPKGSLIPHAITTAPPTPSTASPPMPGSSWDKYRSAIFLLAFGFYVLVFTSLAISVSVATAFQENYFVEGEVLDAKEGLSKAPQPADAIVKAQTLSGVDIDETETNSNGKFLLVIPRKRMEGFKINFITTLQKNQIPTNESKSIQIHLRGWNKRRIVFHADYGSPAKPAATPTQPSSPAPQDTY